MGSSCSHRLLFCLIFGAHCLHCGADGIPYFIRGFAIDIEKHILLRHKHATHFRVANVHAQLAQPVHLNEWLAIFAPVLLADAAKPFRRLFCWKICVFGQQHSHCFDVFYKTIFRCHCAASFGCGLAMDRENSIAAAFARSLSSFMRSISRLKSNSMALRLASWASLSRSISNFCFSRMASDWSFSICSCVLAWICACCVCKSASICACSLRT